MQLGPRAQAVLLVAGQEKAIYHSRKDENEQSRACEEHEASYFKCVRVCVCVCVCVCS